MPYSLEDLTEVMEDRSAAGSPPPDMLAQVRRRVARGRRRRAAVAGSALAVAASFFAVRQVAQPPADSAPQVMTGAVNDAFATSPPKEGLDPVREVSYSAVGRKAHVRFTPTGPSSMITYWCSARLRVFHVRNGLLSSAGCGKDGGGASYLDTTPGVPVAFDVVALPAAAAREPMSVVGLDRYVTSHDPVAGTWRLQIYSGQCPLQKCYRPGSVGPSDLPRPAAGERLTQRAGTADGRLRRVAFTPSGAGVRLHLTCADGAASALLRLSGRLKILGCRAAGSRGVLLDEQVEPGRRTELRMSVVPGSAVPLDSADTSLDGDIKGIEPAGTWALEVYDL
ncbi:hypothetical protein E1293_09905 [Actinomadura darangshiensis]|uniref:Uncharacterized protein n=1 Tax=Actinomadura darangshiensis TaxID=705336 RepID=A0A4R5BM54_9ACTN|nr:hypothetical protein [Actinomadura darangshiensis]TDD86190.1 hypothetical protein E1293_09905 [Actinomadura darangshiensis]